MHSTRRRRRGYLQESALLIDIVQSISRDSWFLFRLVRLRVRCWARSRLPPLWRSSLELLEPIKAGGSYTRLASTVMTVLFLALADMNVDPNTSSLPWSVISSIVIVWTNDAVGGNSWLQSNLLLSTSAAFLDLKYWSMCLLIASATGPS